ncbi:MAG: hypothetical protein COB41_03340 [Proteobacteria bacterium]|nr:MAG: hypothetical protein COB41_03340 [Pseudomonadota bacterium]
MKDYQDSETGQIYAFDDGIDPFKLNNRNIPVTLTETVMPKPSESHLWYDGAWVKDTEVPKGYKPPVSSVPSYNPAWVAFLRPYTVILQSKEDKLQISLEQANSGSYDNDKLSKAVAALPLGQTGFHALISYDGAIAIPRDIAYPSEDKATDEINKILCAILLGGVHAEVIYQQDLCCGALNKGKDIFIYTPCSHNRLRNQWVSIEERLLPLMHPRVLSVSDLLNAYGHGMSVIGAINNFSSFFLLHGYTAMAYQNRSDALASLWIVVEQLTSFLWEKKFLSNPKFHPASIKKRRDSMKDNRTWSTAIKHELLWQTGLLSEGSFVALTSARKQRNNLVHDGKIPDFSVIRSLWESLSELFQSASGLSQSRMQQLSPVEMPRLGFPENNNFDEWQELSEKLKP